ncbi:CBS domain-containing protein [Thiovibrio frasassiensis]|uniref:CBS domain-containing protein n=1 Tax=Thiovibrio frasassiensis TaxID=2984131 RepID=A0A9X4MFK7_9BACT|nr:CBS domain-containing protein [Thiovibrio frasassiensis]MDG4475737.1 CBS domain-containing protein [Thiovibrio frasassiensis]
MEVITTHVNADFDGLASMIAAQKLYPEAVLAFSGSQEKNLRDFLAQSVQYHYTFQRLKNIPQEQIHRLIVVDTRQASRIGDFAQCLHNPGLDIHLYDHHPDTPEDLHGSVEHVLPVGSTTTIFVQLFREKDLHLTPEEATVMAMAIYEDTGNFAFDTTTPEDLQAAAWLLGQGANLNAISQFIAQELTSQEVTLLHALIKSATTYTIHGLDLVVAKVESPEYIDEFSVIVRRFMVMENLNTLFALTHMGGRTHLIARSRIPEVNVGAIARDFGGGGHASAASATIKDLTLIEAEERLIQLLHKHVHPQRMARELMSSPVISGPPTLTINGADELLNRYNITVLLIVNDRHEPIGLISRLVVGKSIHLGLGDSPVSDYMTTDFATLPPTATLADIQELIIGNRQRFIPVVAEGVVQGVITRTDLLHLLVNDPAHIPRRLLADTDQPSTARNRNLSGLMAEVLNREIICLLQTLGEVAQETGCHAYAVGGFVRDLLLHIKNLDLDVVIEGDALAYAKKLGKKLGGKVRTHEKFGTAVVKLPDGFKIDIATARLEYYEYPAAMPTVELSSIKLDLYRRDFTINAMAIHLNPDTFGTLVDFFNCQNDLKDRQIRILHNLSFVEDPTRIFRAIRFEQRMGFKIGRHTEKLIKNAVKMELFDRFFGHRFFNELISILSEENPIPAIHRMADLGLLRFLHPTLRIEPKLATILEETRQALAWHRLLYLDEPCRQWLVYLLALMSSLPVREVVVFCERFEVPLRHRQFLGREKLAVTRIAAIMKRAMPETPSGMYHLLKDLSPEGLLHLMGLLKKKGCKKAISLYVTDWRQLKPETDGNDLAEMGYRTGPLYGTILRCLLDARLDGLVHDRASETAFIKEHFSLPDQ